MYNWLFLIDNFYTSNMKAKSDFDSAFPVLVSLPVQWGDMDAAQHVNNVNYLRWGESARIGYFAEMGMDLSFSEGVGPILGYQDCKYIFPMTFPDTAIIGCRTVSIAEDRFTMECKVFSEQHQRISAISKQVIIPYDYSTLSRAKMPEEWQAAIRRIEGIEL